jgi:cell division protein FtsZ
MIELCVDRQQQEQKSGASLKVIGVGGAGGNAVTSMISSEEMNEVSFMIANTDAQALNLSPAQTKIQMGSKITKGLGTGSNPDIGRRAAEEDLDNILEKIEDTDILFLTGGLGGGTGSGALPVIAESAKEKGVLTVAIVTKPFIFEGRRRAKITEEAVKNLKATVDTLIIVPNQRLLEIADAKISMLDAFSLSNDILKQAIKGISDIITKSGHINVDFADVKTIMKDMGMAIMGTGKASGEYRAKEAATKAINSPLLENVSIEGAKGVLINISGNTDLGLYEINEAASLIYELVSEEANIILGSVIDPAMGDEIMVTVIATGFEEVQKQATKHNESDKQISILAKKSDFPSQDTPKQTFVPPVKEMSKLGGEEKHSQLSQTNDTMKTLQEASEEIPEEEESDEEEFSAQELKKKNFNPYAEKTAVKSNITVEEIIREVIQDKIKERETGKKIEAKDTSTCHCLDPNYKKNKNNKKDNWNKLEELDELTEDKKINVDIEMQLKEDSHETKDTVDVDEAFDMNDLDTPTFLRKKASKDLQASEFLTSRINLENQKEEAATEKNQEKKIASAELTYSLGKKKEFDDKEKNKEKNKPETSL